MRLKSHFLRELAARDKKFSSDFVVHAEGQAVAATAAVVEQEEGKPAGAVAATAATAKGGDEEEEVAMDVEADATG